MGLVIKPSAGKVLGVVEIHLRESGVETEETVSRYYINIQTIQFIVVQLKPFYIKKSLPLRFHHRKVFSQIGSENSGNYLIAAECHRG